jgi:hypothetical protein
MLDPPSLILLGLHLVQRVVFLPSLHGVHCPGGLMGEGPLTLLGWCQWADKSGLTDPPTKKKVGPRFH